MISNDPDQKVDSYKILTIDDNGNAEVDFFILGKSYIQKLCGLPLDKTELQTRLVEYAKEYRDGLLAAQAPKNGIENDQTGVNDLINTPINF